MAGGGVQFYGVEKVIDMYDSRSVDAWSIWHGKEFQFKGSGDAELRTILEALKNNFNDPVYTLRVYEGIEPDKIKSNTPHDGSFNFKLNVPVHMEGIGYASPNSSFHSLSQEVAELKRRIEQGPPEDEPETIGSVLEGVAIEVIKNPDKAMQWIGLFKELLGMKTIPGQPGVVRQLQQPPAAVGTIHATEEINQDERLNRLAVAIDTLEKADPKLIEHLEKLADMANKTPGKLKSLLLMLETF